MRGSAGPVRGGDEEVPGPRSFRQTLTSRSSRQVLTIVSNEGGDTWSLWLVRVGMEAWGAEQRCMTILIVTEIKYLILHYLGFNAFLFRWAPFNLFLFSAIIKKESILFQ